MIDFIEMIGKFYIVDISIRLSNSAKLVTC